MESVAVKVAAFVAIICAGYLAGRSGKFGTKPGATISKIVFTFTLPCAVIHAFGSADFTPDMLWLIPLGLACAVVPYFITLLITRDKTRVERVFFLLTSCGFNIGCFALPFVQSLFSPEMAVAVCMFDAGNAVMMAGGSYALTGVFAGAEGRVEHPLRFIGRRLVTSLPFDSYIVLVLLALFDVHLPQAIVDFTEPMASANAFLAMLMLGFMVSFSVDADKLRNVAKLIALRLAYAAVLGALIFALTPFDYTMHVVLLMLLFAPSSALSPMFTMMSKGDEGLAGLATALTIVTGTVAATAIVLLSGAAG